MKFVLGSSGRLFWRACTAVILLPGVVAFVMPWLLRPNGASWHAIGWPVIAVGVGLLGWCVRDFLVVGRGTLAPWAPPQGLVITGVYRVSRNPMYVAVLLILCGWALLYRSPALWLYAAVVALAFHLRVVFGEEPELARRHGAQWVAYRDAVPRWLVSVHRSARNAMSRQRSMKREVLAAVISVAVSLAGAIDLIGHPARTVQILTIFAGGVGAGVGLGRALDRWRADRRASASTSAE